MVSPVFSIPAARSAPAARRRREPVIAGPRSGRGNPRRCACLLGKTGAASGGPISCPVKKWGKETAGGKIPISSPRTPYLKRRKELRPLRIPLALKETG